MRTVIALSLVAAMILTPMRAGNRLSASGSATRFRLLRSNLARMSASSPASHPVRIKALAPENEEEVYGTLEAHASIFSAAPTHAPGPVRHLEKSILTIEPYPLRC